MQWLAGGRSGKPRSIPGQSQGKNEFTGRRSSDEPALSVHRQLPGPPAQFWKVTRQTDQHPLAVSAISAVQQRMDVPGASQVQHTIQVCAHFRAWRRSDRIPFVSWACAHIRGRTGSAGHQGKCKRSRRNPSRICQPSIRCGIGISIFALPRDQSAASAADPGESR